MDILNFISWIRDRRVIKKTPAGSLVPIGIPDARRDDKYLTCAIDKKDLIAEHLETTLFAFPFNYAVVPTMQETGNTISGPSFFFGNELNFKSYVVSGMISVQTNASFWYIGTLSGSEPLTGNLPWKVTGTVFAFDDSLPGGGGWLQTGLCDGARFGNTNGGTVQSDFCTIIEDYNSTPGSIELYLAVNSPTIIGDIFGNVAFQYEFFVDENVDVTFTI